METRWQALETAFAHILKAFLLQENRRRKRLCQRASRLDVADLLEIAATKGFRLRDVRPEPDSGDESPGDEAEHAPAHAAASSGAAGSGIIRHNDGLAASEAKPPAIVGAAALAEAAHVDNRADEEHIA